MTVSVVIPSRNERFLPETVADVLVKARGDVEVVIVLDGYWPDPPIPHDPRINILHHENPLGMRQCVNDGVAAASGEYIMKLDAHCLMAEGWDETLLADCDGRDIVIPRRYSLEPEGWKIREGRPVIDYEFISFPYLDEFKSVRVSNKWFERMEQRRNVLVDEDMTFQGSCYFMRREYFHWLGGLQVEGYGSLICESEEIGNKSWLTGGRVMVNKKTWYAHLHKGKQYGRMYFINKKELRRGRRYHIDMWMHDRWPRATRKFEWLVDHFWPVPTWPEDWRDPRYEAEYLKSMEAGGDV